MTPPEHEPPELDPELELRAIRWHLEASEGSLEESYRTYDTARTINMDGSPRPWGAEAMRGALAHHTAALFRLEPLLRVLTRRRDQSVVATWLAAAAVALASVALVVAIAGVLP